MQAGLSPKRKAQDWERSFQWQNELLAYREEQRKPYSQTYLKTLHTQFSAIFNRLYDLRSNPAAKAGNMGTEEPKEMLFWAKAEYQRFAERSVSVRQQRFINQPPHRWKAARGLFTAQ